MACISEYPADYHRYYVEERQKRIKTETELNQTTALLCKLIRNYAAEHDLTPLQAAKDLQFNLGVTGLEGWWVINTEADRERVRDKLLNTFDLADLQLLKEVVDEME